ncbi:MAG: O-methyltransferase [Bacteroidota bacterium]|nr:MAG: O-methyltransferase [Bacteroidota bacterium]
MIVNRPLEDYLVQHSSQEDPLLKELSRETHLKAINPRMLSGHLQGKLLEYISRMIQPLRILEIGTYTGYSTICLARGLKNGGHLHTIECNDEIVRIPKKYFKKAGLESNITLITGNALEIIPKLDEIYDLVFIDANKQEYLQYFELCLEKTRSGSTILVDNVLWDGKVLNADLNPDADTKAIMDFNQKLVTDARVEVLMLPLRDGISIIRKL